MPFRRSLVAPTLLSVRTLLLSLLLCAVTPYASAQQARTVVSLNGNWDIADSVAPDSSPTVFTHKCRVPGLAHSAQLPFPDVDLFDSREIVANRVRRKEMPPSDIVTTAGISRQQRNYFWYRTTFDPGSRQANAILKINKAQFGIAVWLNGKKIGEHFPILSAMLMFCYLVLLLYYKFLGGYSQVELSPTRCSPRTEMPAVSTANAK